MTCSLPFCVPPKTERGQQDAVAVLSLVVTWAAQGDPLHQQLNGPEMHNEPEPCHKQYRVKVLLNSSHLNGHMLHVVRLEPPCTAM